MTVIFGLLHSFSLFKHGYDCIIVINIGYAVEYNINFIRLQCISNANTGPQMAVIGL